MSWITRLSSVFTRNATPVENIVETSDAPQACLVMGLSRETFYRYESAVDEVIGDVETLLTQLLAQTTILY